jgi:hypothetical protein
VSQYLIRNVIYEGSQALDEVVFRVLLFKFFNKTETWEMFRREFGTPTWRDYEFDAYLLPLNRARSSGATLYSAAYVVPPPRRGEPTKHANHLRLIESMMRDGLTQKIAEASRFADVYRALVAYPSVGPFIGFQLAVDLNYSDATEFSEMDFVIAGPGAKDGIRKCFGPASSGIEEDIIKYVAARQADYFEVLGLNFEGLFGRPLQLVDCQNLFCEVDKYARVAHPEVAGVSGRLRIKQRYRPSASPVTAWFPPKWNLNVQR